MRETSGPGFIGLHPSMPDVEPWSEFTDIRKRPAEGSGSPARGSPPDISGLVRPSPDDGTVAHCMAGWCQRFCDGNSEGRGPSAWATAHHDGRSNIAVGSLAGPSTA